MEWFLASLAMLLGMLGAGFAAGALIVVWLPRRLQPAARLFLAVPSGWALLTLPAALLGWFGHGFAGWHCLVITGSLALAGAWVSRRRLPGWGREFPLLAGFGLVACLPILFPLLRHGAFSEYNDTFIYISHAQWLQHHGFFGHAHTDGGHPVWAQVIAFKVANLRMGASFLLGWVQAVFHLEWSYQIYPAFAALGLICGALAIGGTVLAACPGARLEAWLAALAVAATVNGFAFGAAEGFLGQTWGLAFAALAFALRGWELTSAPSRPGPWRTGVPIGVAVAAAMHCYWDLVPLTGAGLAASYLVPWPGRRWRNWRLAWAAAWPALLVSLALVNVEWIRAVQGIVMNLSMVVANPVNWSLWTFPAHALGLKSSIWDGSRWITTVPSTELLVGAGTALALLVAAVWAKPPAWLRLVAWPGIGAGHRVVRWRGRVLVPGAVWLGLSAALFCYFRYVAKSPWRDDPANRWPDGVGQSWSQYKLICWDSAFAIGVAAAAGIGLSRKFLPRLWQPVLLLTLTIWCGTGLGWNYRLAAFRSRFLCVDAACAEDPFVVLRGVREMLAGLPASEWIYLDWPHEQRAKYRQLLTYFLPDHPLAADWHDDGYIDSYVTDEDARRNASNCPWILTYHPNTAGEASNTALLAFGGLTLLPGKTRVFTPVSVESPYGQEIDGTHRFYWTDHRLRVDFRLQKIPGAVAPEWVRLQFEYRAATARALRIECTSEAGTVAFPLAAGVMAQAWRSQPLRFAGDDLRVEITSDEPAKRSSARDGRALAFMVMDLALEPAGANEAAAR